MNTEHRVHVGDARRLDGLADDSVELVVTSPPYPMVEMWDEAFAELDPEVTECLDREDGRAAFERMHAELDRAWASVARVLVDGGIACVNVGDATRTVDGSFRLYGNHARVVRAFEALGFEPLPDVLWRKPANSVAKFMGSGMLPPNAYTTLEHEYVLVFRNGSAQRSFEPGAERRYGAAFFWEERNEWFSDVWTDVGGTHQALADREPRERSGAFPLEIPYRLVNMYSVYGDTVLDPFWGTGTTSLAAMVAGRNSVGYELRGAFAEVFDERVEAVEALSREVVGERVRRHERFAESRANAGEPLGYEAEHHDFPVMTKQETGIRLYAVDDVERTDDGYRLAHVAFDGSGEGEAPERPRSSPDRASDERS